MDLSIVIPAYREAGKIGRDVTAAGRFLAAAGLSGEIIVVDDGSPDDTAGVARAAPVPAGIARHVIRFERNRGKGAAVREGMRASRASFAMFADSGLCIPYGNALRGLELLRRNECELAHGSRWLPDSRLLRPHRPYRRLLSRLFRDLIPWVLGMDVSSLTDTQCGFKLYKGETGRVLYGECISDGFVFDIEVILRARRHGWRIREFPVDWTNDPDSRFPSVLGPVRTAVDLLRLKYLLRRSARGR